ncbi:4-(cytidine 5'-diphospho)-2-C-methyl-D-erythritol kinase [Arcanobacterium bovis]|uniref:4-diphosphocytidyl-2-C-methyl-D-erythritol kinase n=1 Tax=Arcanobacterium bovis TaxID=2529275 RepID=A0A4Q9V266_9ACTO|nr:4-(cytidine 5'-diphospho)-2-C-methyl-D-erythritol kinase [Arcanobacterium bovis]TBW23731.1 4-(cytidine 5'-diphospho)-2-C-methyl-D-erythritol kinase [Arcanobacterium bovis]
MVKLERVIASAPAKVNLALRVGGIRQDGFHPLDTVFEALDLFDDVTATPAAELSMEITGIGADLPCDHTNLVLQAAQLLQRVTGTTRGAHLSVTKRIPVAGGMAGGSADAAATLVALNALWELGLSTEELMELGAQLGSDVPFALQGSVARGTSRGEALEAIKPGAMHGWVLLTNPVGLSTPAVFRKFDDLSPDVGEPTSTQDLCRAVEGDDLAKIGQLLANDLEAPAFALRPDLAEIIVALQTVGHGVVLSGSGPTIAVLCKISQLESLSAELANAFPELSVVSAVGPTAGAHIRQQN